MGFGGGRQVAVDRWIRDGHASRSALLQPLASRLLNDVAAPNDVTLVIEPLRSILDRARDRSLPVDRDGHLDRAWVLELNHDLGFDSPAECDGSPSYLESEMLVDIAVMTRALTPDLQLSPLGFTAVDHPARLWNVAASAMLWWPASPWLTHAWEIELAWLLDDEDPEYLMPALKEVIGEPLVVEERYTVGFFSLYTLARGLCMFTPAELGQTRPHLTAAGKATALKALQAKALSYLPDPVLN